MNPVAWQRQSQLQWWLIAATIALCKHHVCAMSHLRFYRAILSRDFVARQNRATKSQVWHGTKRPEKPQVASVLRLSSKTLSCLYTSCTCVTILCVSNLRRTFSKCLFRWHSALYPSFRRKKSALNIQQITRWQLSAFRVPQISPSDVYSYS